MLRYLQVRDFAIIDAIEIEFSAGLTVLTGETGAGKSILVDALEVLAGGRAGTDVVRTGAERADISATVDITRTAGELRRVLDEQSISSDGELVLRRVIGSDGRSRAWLNGQSVPIQVLRTVCALLFDIHGQHEFQALVHASKQRELVDGYGRLDGLASQVRAAHSVWLALLNRSLTLEGAADERNSRLDLLRYQLREIEALQPSASEFTELGEEHARLANRGHLIEAARGALDALYESDTATAHGLLARSISALSSAKSMDARLAELAPLLEEAAIRVKETAHSLAQYLESLDMDPQRLDAVERRLSALEEMARKHRISPPELPAKQAALAAELAAVENAAADIGTLRNQLAAALGAYQELSRQLSLRRAAAARALAKEVSARMQELGMTGGRFMVEVAPLENPEPAAHGIDRIEFRVSTNPGQPPRAVAKIASGGELARLSLAVQVSCADDAAPCMIFDEVDAGIGGAVAEIVGRELRSLGTASQVLCVTHLPQVAAQGHQHLRVAKLTDGRTTRTSVTTLGDEARVEEIARMLGGIEISTRARAHALEMLQQAAVPVSTVAPNPAASRSAGSRPKPARDRS